MPLTNHVAAHRTRVAGLVALGGATALALVVIGRAPVPLLSGDGRYGHDACFLNWAEGELVVDPGAGTAITETVRQIDGSQLVRATPIKWPAGYTGRRSGFEVEVLNRSGEVVALTGSRYHIAGGYEGDYWLTCNEAPTPLL